MKFLFDTNIFIPLEPSTTDDVSLMSIPAMKLQRLITEYGHQAFLHPKSRIDIAQDRRINRKKMRELVFDRYPEIEETPFFSSFFKDCVGNPPENSNDFIDNHLLNSVYNNAVNFFITEDRVIHKKARRLNISEKVLLISEAINLLEKDHYEIVLPLPVVEMKKAYQLNIDDPIFDSLREDYKGFNKWFTKKCQEEHRDCFVINRDNVLDAVAIIKEEYEPFGLKGKTLKLCTLKVSETAKGVKYGELLLKTILQYSYEHNIDQIYVTAFEKNRRVCVFLDNFGFSDMDGFMTELGEKVFIKRLHPSQSDYELNPLDFHIKFGPKYVHNNTDGFLVPIWPEYHNMIFPELDPQSNIFEGEYSYGNSILKAYLSLSPLKEMEQGCQLYFYRSHKAQGIIARGVVEKTMRSRNPEEINSFVWRRTVYPKNEIDEFCSRREVLAILFRQSNSFREIMNVEKLKLNYVFKRPPQSIMKISKEGLEWLRSQQTV